MRKRIASAVILIAVASILLALPAVASAGVKLNSYEKQVVKLVNKERAAKGLVKLKVSTKLTRAARAHSKAMGKQQFFSHNSASGETFSKRLIRYGYKKSGYRYWKVGENIFWGSGLLASPVNVVDQWMSSPSHRKLILTKSFRHAGIGAVKSSERFRGTSNAWFFTLDFGRRIKR